ncbi:hypothetical protein HOV30_gp189 [Erwinia phage Derbicus]|uniref:Uncharacterized protein n=2 Tax=Derbicusvirus derbicus TaxID=2734104 RepID=A0A482IDS1_9CAUD|nr:hypothetical protein BIZ82_gp190 [Erwinia phage vB_EamM_EarlPhillipIV]YP_009821233.1 hypothetical protein HOV30_gp189 [Erwinia phage Derbicus]ANZ49039.1 hypothetical protein EARLPHILLIPIV_190 [Erwinia phage vB_EamM_EarlPhillipIV]QBP07615.1 hypothetical protein DERBICUS_189 [Erwinia phage Derbicus]
MVAGIIKLLPLLTFLLEVFKTDDGKFTAKAKAFCLAMFAVFSFAAYVSYAYVQQFHALVELKAHQQYLIKSEGEAVGRALRLENRITELENKLDICRSRPPYEGASLKQPPPKAADIVPIPVVTKPAPIPKRPIPFTPDAITHVTAIPPREDKEKGIADRMDKITRHINN